MYKSLAWHLIQIQDSSGAQKADSVIVGFQIHFKSIKID